MEMLSFTAAGIYHVSVVKLHFWNHLPRLGHITNLICDYFYLSFGNLDYEANKIFICKVSMLSKVTFFQHQ